MGHYGDAVRSSSRRDAILASALELFRQRGFHAVGIDEIGAAAGISGPGVYRHFPSKDSLLVALLDYITERMLDGARGIVGASLPDRTALEQLVALHVSFAAEERALLAVWMQDWRSLPEADRNRIQRRQAEYAGEWGATLARLRPELSYQEVETVVHAAFGAINSVAFHDSGLERKILDPLLADLALAVLGGG
jgi:AcrR family transcriptional regulator